MGSPVPLDTAARRRTRARARSALAAARRRWLSPQRLLIACLVAVVAAAVLVVYLERRAAALQRARTDMVLRQVCERTAAALATRTRELFGAAVLGTIESIGHREIEQYQPAPRRPGARRRHAPARLRRPLLLLARAHGAAVRPAAALLPSRRRGRRDRRPRRWGWRRLLRGAGPGRGAVAARRTPARVGRSLRGRGGGARRGAAPGRLPLHVGEPEADRGVRDHRLRRRSRRASGQPLRPPRGRRPRAAPQPGRRSAAPRAARRGRRRTSHHRAGPRRRQPAVRVRAHRHPVLPQPRARQLPGAAAAGGELAPDRPPRGAVPRRLVVRPVAARRGRRPAADRGRVRRRREPRGGPALAAPVRLRPQRLAPAADAAGHALGRRRDARARAAAIAREDQALRRHRAGPDRAPVGARRPDPPHPYRRPSGEHPPLAAPRSRGAGGARRGRRPAPRRSPRRSRSPSTGSPAPCSSTATPSRSST